MRRTAMLLVVTSVAGMLWLFFPAPQVRAADVCAGTGTATLSSPFVYPVIGQIDGDTAPPFDVTVMVRAASFTFNLGTGLCALASPALSATGAVNGWCGLAAGQGVTSTGDAFTLDVVGSVVIVTGGLSGGAHVIPDTTSGESCLVGADNFLLTGGAVITDCSVAQAATSTSSPSSVSVANSLHIHSSQSTALPGGGKAHLDGHYHGGKRTCAGK